MSRLLTPIVAGILGLMGLLGVTLFLYGAATTALDGVLEERLRGAGATAAALIGEAGASRLRDVMEVNELEGAYWLSPSLQVLADATGPAGIGANLLRVDVARARRALGGEVSVEFAYSLGELQVATGYFPVRDAGGAITSVLALEAGQTFAGARGGLRRALWLGVFLSGVGALALGLAAWRWLRSEEQRRDEATRAARGDTMVRMAAMVAHEVRNPLGVIRGAVELIRARSEARLGEEDREALIDVMGEVERLRRLTEDFLDLTREPPLEKRRVDLAEVAAEAARGIAHSHPGVDVVLDVPSLAVEADPGRLRQVLVNLLLNGVQAGARKVELRGEGVRGRARLVVRDDGSGIAETVRSNLFEPFAAGRVGGRGLGLAISRRLLERHGGELALESDGQPGATFVIWMPLAPE